MKRLKITGSRRRTITLAVAASALTACGGPNSPSTDATEAAMGSATLAWTPPTQNTDGSPVTHLAGYTIYYGTGPTSLTRTIRLSDPSLTNYAVGKLTPGSYYFSIRAYTGSGTQGLSSALASKTIPR